MHILTLVNQGKTVPADKDGWDFPPSKPVYPLLTIDNIWELSYWMVTDINKEIYFLKHSKAIRGSGLLIHFIYP